MTPVLIDLIPLILGAALVPLYPIVVLLLLQSPSGLLKASAFVAGNLAVRLAQGLLFGMVFAAADAAYPDDGPRLIASTLLTVVGLLLLVGAYKKWRKEPDGDDPPPKWMTAIADLSVARAAATGGLYVLVAVKQWVFTLSALAVIRAADLTDTAATSAYLIFVLATQLLVLPPLLAYAVAPGRVGKPLQAAEAWLERNNRVIVVTVSLVFGIWFLYKGISGLIN